MAGLFDAAALVTAEEAARLYGVQFRGKRAFCPFHDDGRHPALSFKDGRFNCFACGAHGDSIDLAQRLLQVSNVEAADRINVDFGLSLSRDTPDGETLGRMRKERADRALRQAAIDEAHTVLCWAWRYLRDCGPDAPGGLSGAYAALLHRRHIIDWLLDELEDFRHCDGHYGLILEYGEAVDAIARVKRISDCARQPLGGHPDRLRTG